MGRFKSIKPERMKSYHDFFSQNCLKPPLHLACVEQKQKTVEIMCNCSKLFPPSQVSED